MFTIVSVYRHSSELVSVKVTVDAKAWRALKLKGQLGQLYGIDISNAAYRNFGVKAYYPIVDDRAKAKNGIKVIELTYADTEWKEVNNVIHVDFANRCRAA